MDFKADSFKLFDREWALLTAGNSSRFNTMTISWGGLGTLWGKPVATVYVKPCRYTHEFMEKNDCFTLSFYSENFKKALSLLGSVSGRDRDKVTESGLTPEFLPDAVTFREARVTLLCKKIYRQDLDLAAIPQDAVEKYYRTEAPHTMYLGEVLRVIGH